jgi:hypothetical protein
MILNNVVMRQRRDTASGWKDKNPVLDAGQIGVETDTTFVKIGDGVTAWRLLPYTCVPMISDEVIDALFVGL